MLPVRRSESRTAGIPDTSFAFWRLSGIVRAYSNAPQMSGQYFRWSSISLPTMSVGYFPGGKSAADTTAAISYEQHLCYSSPRHANRRDPTSGSPDLLNRTAHLYPAQGRSLCLG